MRTHIPAENSAYGGSARGCSDRHLHGLDALPVPVTLVTDTAYRLVDRRGAEIDRFDLLFDRQLPEPADSWLWRVAPFGEEAPDTQRIHEVAAFTDWHAARR